MEIFRFAQARPARQVPIKIELSDKSPFGDWVKKQYWDKPNGNAERIDLAEVKTQIGKLTGRADQLAKGDQLRKFLATVQDKVDDPAIGPTWFETTIKSIFGVASTALVASSSFIDDVNIISDALLGSKLTGSPPEISAVELLGLFRAAYLIRLGSIGHPGLKVRAFVKDVLRAAVVMPSSAVLFSDTAVPERADAKAQAEEARLEAKELASLRKRAGIFEAALKELETALPTDYQIAPPPAPAPFTYLALTHAFVSGNANISEAAAELALDPLVTPAPDLSDSFTAALLKDRARARSIARDDSHLVRVGSQWIPAMELKPSPSALSSALTDTVRAARPVGIADLLIVKQKIKKYEAGEVAHVENCMAGETRRRSHERTDRLEIDTLMEVETTKEEERDLQSTDKAELKQEAEQIVKADNSVQAGVSLSASYGPVTLSTNLSSSSSTSEQDAKRQANTFSREVVSRAVSRTSERTLVRRTEKKLFQIVETNLHEFTAPDKSRTGIYQWVNKVYEAQVYNYGRRMLYELVIPEPGAFFKQSLAGAKAEGTTLAKPKPIDFLAADLTDSNWYEKAADYQLGTATPPPKPYVTVVQVYAKTGNPINAADGIDIPDGFKAFSARIRLTGSHPTGLNPIADIVVGTTMTRFNSDNGEATVYLPGQVGKIATGIDALNFSVATVSIEVTCKRTERVLNQWQAKLFGELTTAYNTLLSQFEAELDRQRQQEEAKPYGRNPLSDDRIVRGELRKSALALIRRDNFTGFDAVLDDPVSGGPYPNMTKADDIARTVLFFEQAFEWEQMTFRFYEYFWGRKTQWKKDLLLEDKSDQFRAFLSSGSARVVLPVRPGFERLVANYFETGIIANEDELPDLSSPEYLPILNEIKEELQAPGTEKPYGDPWLVVVPTSLVVLQGAADQLPTF